MKSFSKTISPLPFSLVLVFIQPHRNSQSRDQQGHFHPLLVIKKHMLFAAPSQKVRPQMWGCHGEWRHKCELVMHGLVQNTTQRVKIWQFFLQLTHRLPEYWDWGDKTNGFNNCVTLLYIIYYKKEHSIITGGTLTMTNPWLLSH